MERNRGKKSLGERIKSPKNEAFRYGCDGSCSCQLSSLFFSLFMLILRCCLLFGVNRKGHKII